jgi:hypothetical protein
MFLDTITLFHYNTGDHWTIIQKLKQVQNNMINYIYLPPEQRPTVTAISTKLRQLCGTEKGYEREQGIRMSQDYGRCRNGKGRLKHK